MLTRNAISGFTISRNYPCLNIARRLFKLRERTDSSKQTTAFKLMSTNSNTTDKPLSYSSSKAAKWKTIDTLAGTRHDEPPSQLYTVLASLTCFMLYFFLLREENDIDMHLRKGLGETIDIIDELTIQELEIIKEQ